MNWGWSVIAVVGGVFVIFLLTAYVAKPLKWLWWGVLYTGVGALALFLVNWVCGKWGFYIPINPVTALITGVLGLPGLACLVLIKVWIVGI